MSAGADDGQSFSSASAADDWAADATDLFSLLPDELVIGIVDMLGDVSVLVAWAITCRRHYALSTDDTLWRRLCRDRFGPTLHVWAESQGKGAQWLYQAQGRRGTRTTPVGAVVVRDHVYWGDLVDGLPHGYGLAVALPTPHRKEGAAVRTRPTDARAALNGSYYEGHWRAGRAYGYGKRVYPNGTIYEGLWEDCVPHGRGSMTDRDGGSYVGDWHCGQRHGTGTLTTRDGNAYTGVWDNDAPVGGSGHKSHPKKKHHDGSMVTREMSCTVAASATTVALDHRVGGL
ncbi:Morn repeat protein [Pandoravirus kuranda]|uniref:Morn repeat protein n=1 Tax=Pandoravirus kuranda TaxID=3019033 RepID=A0AA95J6P4_9VIRU|nr:Morn repeat protein [Pandoravirus kuranda]